MKKRNVSRRRQVALQSLENAKFSPKGDRTEDQWEARRQSEIKILKKRLNV